MLSVINPELLSFRDGEPLAIITSHHRRSNLVMNQRLFSHQMAIVTGAGVGIGFEITGQTLVGSQPDTGTEFREKRG
jgi:hypothetical protein